MPSGGKLLWAGAVAVKVAACAMFWVASAQAQVVPPRALEQSPPPPPENRFGIPMEGWVVLRYTILPDGRTANVRVVDRMPPTIVERAAVSAVEAWTFEPATIDGAAIEWRNNESVVVFDLPMVPLEPSAFFIPAYLEADEFLKSGEHDKALKRNEGVLATQTSRLGEVGLVQVQKAAIHIALGDLHAAYAAILLATDPRVPALSPTDLKSALQYRNALELELGDAAGALATFARRNEIEPVPANDPMAAQAAAIEQALGGEAPIAIKAKILDKSWTHVPTRRTFAISDVTGQIETIQVECDRRGAELEFAADTEWTLPETWGACTLMVEGDRDTEFVLYEFQ
jgi:TonB family protein